MDFKEDKQRLTHTNCWYNNNNDPEWKESVDQTSALSRQAQHKLSDKMDHDYANDRTRLSGLFQPNNETSQRFQEEDGHINRRDQLLILTPPEGDFEKRIYEEEGPHSYFTRMYRSHLNYLNDKRSTPRQAKTYMAAHQDKDRQQDYIPTKENRKRPYSDINPSTHLPPIHSKNNDPTTPELSGHETTGEPKLCTITSESQPRITHDMFI